MDGQIPLPVALNRIIADETLGMEFRKIAAEEWLRQFGATPVDWEMTHELALWLSGLRPRPPFEITDLN